MVYVGGKSSSGSGRGARETKPEPPPAPTMFTSNFTSVKSRPTGTPKTAGVELIGKTAQEAREIQQASSDAGLALEEEKRKKRAQEALEASINVETPTLPPFPSVDKPQSSLQKFGSDFEAAALSNEALGPLRAGAVSGVARAVGTTFTGFAQQAFGIYDNLRAITTGGDTTSVKKARQSLGDANTLLQQEIDSVKAGEDPTNAYIFLKRAIAANEQIGINTHRKGLDNTRYWIRDGKDLETEILNNNDFLINKYKELINAIQQGAVNNAINQATQPNGNQG